MWLAISGQFRAFTATAMAVERCQQLKRLRIVIGRLTGHRLKLYRYYRSTYDISTGRSGRSWQTPSERSTLFTGVTLCYEWPDRPTSKVLHINKIMNLALTLLYISCNLLSVDNRSIVIIVKWVNIIILLWSLLKFSCTISDSTVI